MNKIKHGLDVFVDYINKLYLAFAAFMLCFIVVTCALQVASRYITFVHILGMEELARIGFVWMVSLALSLCVAYKAHMKIDVIASKINGKLKPYYSILIDLIFLFYLIILFKFSIIKNMKVGNQVTIVFLIKMKYLYSALIVGSGGAIINTVHGILNNIVKIYTCKVDEN